MRSTYLMMTAALLVGCSGSTAEPEIQDIRQEVVDRIPVMMDSYGVDGLSVALVQGGEVLLSEGYGTNLAGEAFTSSTVCPIYSATKVFTSLTIASLVEDGAFDVDQPLGALMDDAPEAWSDVPFWRLLNHSSGIPMIVNQPVFGTLIEDPNSTNADVVDFVRPLALDFQPGEFSRYRQSGYGIAEYILANRFSKEWSELVEEHVTGPGNALNTEHSDVATGKREIALLGSAGGYQTTADDMTGLFQALNSDKIVKRTFLEDWLFDTTYDFDGYSLGSVLGKVGDYRTVGHSGGGRANIRYAPGAGVGVMVCTDDQSNNNIMHDVANMLMDEVLLGMPSLMPIQAKLYTFQDRPVVEMIAAYRAEKDKRVREYAFAHVENTFNQMGYNKLADGKVDDAIAVFRLNVSEFPDSPNVYDSLGEALLEAEDFEGALSNYKMVLRLDPGNAHAKLVIEKIKMKTGEE